MNEILSSFQTYKSMNMEMSGVMNLKWKFMFIFMCMKVNQQIWHYDRKYKNVVILTVTRTMGSNYFRSSYWKTNKTNVTTTIFLRDITNSINWLKVKSILGKITFWYRMQEGDTDYLGSMPAPTLSAYMMSGKLLNLFVPVFTSIQCGHVQSWTHCPPSLTSSFWQLFPSEDPSICLNQGVIFRVSLSLPASFSQWSTF